MIRDKKVSPRVEKSGESSEYTRLSKELDHIKLMLLDLRTSRPSEDKKVSFSV